MKFQNTLIERLAGYAAVFAILAAIVIVSFSQPGKARANPSFFDRSTGTAAATTSPQYMTAGLATTTESWDTGHSIKSTKAMNSAVLQLAIKSSTTVATLFGTTTLAVRIEVSDNGIDWSLSTSSTLQTTSTEQMGNVFIAPSSVTMRTIPVSTPLRFIRALVGVNPGSSNNAGVWMQFVGQSENN